MILRPDALREHKRDDLASARTLSVPGLELEGGRVIVRDAHLAQVIEAIRRERAASEHPRTTPC